MLIDSRQRRWIVFFVAASVAAVVLRWWLGRGTPGGLTGGSRAGLAFGIAGWLLILYAWLLTALRWVPRWWWVGARATWLKGHVWLGSLSVVLILCHSGGRWGGTLEQVLYAAFGLTVLTGVFGLLVQQFLPGLITRRVPSEVPYEQVPHVCARMQQEADLELKKLDVARLPAGSRDQIAACLEKIIHPFLGWPPQPSPLADRGKAAEVFGRLRALPGVATERRDSPAEKVLDRLETFCTERRLLLDQERLQHWLHGWLYLHVPLSAAMLVLGTAHAVMALYY